MKRKMKKMAMMSFCLIAVVVSGITNPINAYAKENMVPDYEVKFLLDSEQVLNSDNLLKKHIEICFKQVKSMRQ